MSKIKIFFFCFLILILSFFSACSKKEKNAGLKNPNQNAGQYDLMRYLPYDSMIVFRCKDLNKTYSEFINGAFYKQLTSYPAVQEFKTEIEKLDASEFEKNFKFKPAVSDFIDLIGNDFAFSFTLKNGMPYFMILSEFSSDSALKKIDENLQYFLSGSKEASISATEYNSAKIKTLKFSLRGGGLLALNALDEETAYEISFCITDKILFISNDVELIKKSADTASGIQTKSILDNLEFQKTFQKIGLNKQVSIYFKPNEISETLLNLPALSKNKNAKEAFELWNNITATGSSFDVRTKTIIKSYTLYNQYAKNQKLLEIYKKKSGELDSARFVPMNAMLFLTTNLLDASGIYEYYINALPPQLKENADGLIKNFEKNIRLSFRKDFLENFKGQVSLALFDIDLNSIVSNPLNALNSIALFAEVKDKKKIDLIF
ncbi:MAG TPA: DUF3352 domain-containing protein, partial [bacterium]|nr:DUF3352 domain-containing protein [bacterium]